MAKSDEDKLLQLIETAINVRDIPPLPAHLDDIVKQKIHEQKSQEE